jgi:NAD(P)-dependent dehydrogenase (short-subunit alcohol dehydrogenase family)
MATDMTASVKERYDRLIGEGLVPHHRWGQPDDVGKAVGALVKGDLPYSTGAVIYLDGGQHLSRF